MKIIVTGGSGFIGSHLIDKLLEHKHDVLIYDLQPPKYNPNCKHVTADVNDIDLLLSSAEGYDMIYHLAAEANVNRFYNNPLASDFNTSNSTLNVLECARKNRISRVLLASTEWIYGSLEQKGKVEFSKSRLVGGDRGMMLYSKLYSKNINTASVSISSKTNSLIFFIGIASNCFIND